MKTLQNALYAILCVILLTACQPKPTIINHPELTHPSINFAPFDNDDCPSTGFGRSCKKESTLAMLGCDKISTPPKQLGSLSPSYPMATCEFYPREHGGDENGMIAGQDYFYGTGGFIYVFMRYVIWKDNKFQLIKNETELQKTFAPIETPEEALSYVLTAKNLDAYYNLAKNPQYKYEVDVLEDTHVEKINNGYTLYLYQYEVFGCGPHWTYLIEVDLTTDGIIKQKGPKHVFRDPGEDHLCVD